MARGMKTGGRKAGTPNKFTKSVRDAIEGAFNAVGGEAYLVAQAKENPNAFLTLLGKVLPRDMSVSLEAGNGIREILADMDGRNCGLPGG